MDLVAWVLKNCKFAANYQGPVEELYHKNAYEDGLPQGVKFNPRFKTLSIQTGVGGLEGEIELTLTDEQVQQLTAPFNTEMSNNYWGEVQQGAVQQIAQEELRKKYPDLGQMHRDWSWDYDPGDGVHAYKKGPNGWDFDNGIRISDDQLRAMGVPV